MNVGNWKKNLNRQSGGFFNKDCDFWTQIFTFIYVKKIV